MHYHSKKKKVSISISALRKKLNKRYRHKNVQGHRIPSQVLWNLPVILKVFILFRDRVEEERFQGICGRHLGIILKFDLKSTLG